MSARIDRKLNIVIQVEADDGSTMHVHSQPISHLVFERYFFTMSQALSGILENGLGRVAGPRAAYLMLKRQAEMNGEWDGAEGIEAGLVGEIRRLTSVVVLSEAGWKPMPLDVALAQKRIGEDDLREVLGILVFFTLVSSILRVKEAASLKDGLVTFWGARFVSSTSTDYASSLTIPTKAETTGETATGSFTVS